MKETRNPRGHNHRTFAGAGLFIALLVLVHIHACSSDNPTGPPPPPPDYTLVASQTIGAAGDTLQVADFRLIVPPGAFAGDAPLALYASSTVKPYGDNMATRLFRLQGLPGDFSLPLLLSIKHTGNLTGDSYLVTTAAYYMPELADTISVYVTLTAADSLGYLHSEIAPPASAPKSSGNEHAMPEPYEKAINDGPLFFGITDMITYTQPSPFLFDIEYPAVMAYQVDAIVDCVIAAHAVLSSFDLGSGFQELEELRIRICPSASFPVTDLACLGVPHRSEWLVDSLLLDAGQLIGSENLSSICRQIRREIHKLLQFDQGFFYDTGPPYHGFQNTWLHCAFCSWSETMRWDEQSLQPTGFAGNEVAPFFGIKAGVVIYELRKPYGRGMSALIKHLVDSYNENLVLQCYQDIAATHPTFQLNTVMNRIGSPATVWWPGFFREYVTGNIYGVTADVFLAGALDTLDVTNNGATTFTNSYRDLSARSCLVKLHDSAVDSNTYVRFQIDSPDIALDQLTTLIFGSKPGLLDYLIEGDDVIISHVEDLMDESYDGLFAVVVNSIYDEPDFSGYGDVSLEITVDSQEEVDLPQLHNVVLRLENIQRLFTFTEDSCGTSAGSMSGSFNYSQTGGQFSGTTFTAAWDNTSYEHHFVGNLAVTLDPTCIFINNFTIHEVETDLQTGYVITRDFTGGAIPAITPAHGYTLEYQVAGTSTCDYFNMQYEGTNTEDDCIVVIDHIACSSNSGIFIGFFP
jgi:hypothetical protein